MNPYVMADQCAAEMVAGRKRCAHCYAWEGDPHRYNCANLNGQKALPTQQAARDRLLAQCFEAAGLVYGGIVANTKYRVKYLVRGLPAPPTPPPPFAYGYEPHFVLPVEGFERLNGLVSDPVLLAYVAWHTRRDTWARYLGWWERQRDIEKLTKQYGELVGRRERDLLLTIAAGGTPTGEEHASYDAERTKVYNRLTEAVRRRVATDGEIARIVGPEPPMPQRPDWYNFIAQE